MNAGTGTMSLSGGDGRVAKIASDRGANVLKGVVQRQRRALGGVLRPFLFFEKEPKIPAGVSKRGRCFVETHRNTSKGLSLLQDLVSAAVPRQRWSSSFNFAIISNILS